MARPGLDSGALGGEVRATLAEPLEKRKLALVMGTQGGVPSLARHGDPPLARPDKAGNAESRSGPEYDLSCLRLGCAAADLVKLGCGKMRQRERERREVVEHEKIFEPDRAAELVLGEGPGRIGEVDFLAGDRSRHRDGSVIRRRGKLSEIGTERGAKGRVGGATNLADAGKLERSEVGNGEARVGAADIGDNGLSRQPVLSLHSDPYPRNAAPGIW